MTWLHCDIPCLSAQLNAQGVIKFDQIKAINTNAARCWFIGLLFAVTADLYRLRNNLQRIQLLEKSDLRGNDALKKELGTLKKFVTIVAVLMLLLLFILYDREKTKIMLETAQDTLDLVIPGSILEYIKVDSGIVGLAGTVTSLIGWQAAWPKS